MPNYRADLYAAGERFDHTERYDARHEVEAIDTARQLVVAFGLNSATVFKCDGLGHAARIAKVGAEQ